MPRFVALALSTLLAACSLPGSFSVSGRIEVDERVIRELDHASFTSSPIPQTGERDGFCARDETQLHLGLADAEGGPSFSLRARGGWVEALEVRLDGRTHTRLGECPVAASFSDWDDVVAFDCDVVAAEGRVARFSASLTLEGCLASDDLSSANLPRLGETPTKTFER